MYTFKTSWLVRANHQSYCLDLPSEFHQALLVEALRCNLFHLLDLMEVALDQTPLAPLEQVGFLGIGGSFPVNQKMRYEKIRKNHREIVDALEVCC